VSFDDWMLALHVLSAFAYVGGIVLFWVLVVAVRKTDTPEETIRMEPIAKVGNVAVGIGAGGTILLGIWLAFRLDSYAIWDGWIIAAIVLWAVGGAIGGRLGAGYRKVTSAGAGADSSALVLNLALIVTLVVILIDMIYKPGAS
jgi:uncharacterized membrane protein